MKEKKSKLTTDDMVERLATILKHGLNIEMKSEAERMKYVADLIHHVVDNTYYNAFYDHDTKTVMVETSYFDPIICVDVSMHCIRFLPLSEDSYYQAFMKVLEFIWMDQKRRKAEVVPEESTESEEKKERPSFDYL